MVELFSNFFLNIVVILFAMWMGGLATTIYGRIPNDIPLGPSHKPMCDHCGTAIKFKYFFPIIGYIISKGKCVKCDNKIPRVYLYLEIAITIFVLLIALQFDFRGDIFFDERFITKSILGAYLITLLFIYNTHKQIKVIDLFISVVASYTAFFFVSKTIPLEKNENVMCVTLLSCCGKIIPIIFFAVATVLFYFYHVSKKNNLKRINTIMTHLSAHHIIVVPIIVQMIMLFVK